MIYLTIKKAKEFITYDYFWRCFKLTFYTFFLEAYYLLYFNTSNVYAPFEDGNFQIYQIIIGFELLLSFVYLFLLIGGIFKYKSLTEKNHKVWFGIFIIFLGLWFTTVWYKFGIVCIHGNIEGLLYRSPLQNLVTYWVLGVNFHYEPGIYLVHKTWLIHHFNLQSILDVDAYVDNIKYFKILSNNEHIETIIKYHKRNENSVLFYVKALRKYTQSFKIVGPIGEERLFDKDFFYYWVL